MTFRNQNISYFLLDDKRIRSRIRSIPLSSGSGSESWRPKKHVDPVDLDPVRIRTLLDTVPFSGGICRPLFAGAPDLRDGDRGAASGRWRTAHTTGPTRQAHLLPLRQNIRQEDKSEASSHAPPRREALEMSRVRVALCPEVQPEEAFREPRYRGLSLSLVWHQGGHSSV